MGEGITAKPLGAQDQLRAVRDMRPNARVYVVLLEDGAPFAWGAWIEWRENGGVWQAYGNGATMPEAVAALRQELKTPSPAPTNADVEYENIEREGMKQQ